MRKLLYLFIFFSLSANAAVINVGDTTLTSNWNAGGDILNITGKISGSYQISNAIIVANPFIQIFDTTITLSNVQCDKFYVMWYGANTSNQDNSTQIQLAINACNNRAYPLIFPAGVFKTSRQLTVGIIGGDGKYLQSQVKIHGNASFWGDGGSQILYSGDSTALRLQLNKGSVISGLIIKGGWVSPSGSVSSYYALTDSEYTNQGSSGNGIGLSIDQTGVPGQTSGSTGCYFYDLQITGFKTLISISNNATQNGEILLFDRIQFGQAYWGVKTYQPQEKANEFRHIYSWGAINYLFTISRGNYLIDGLNIAGRCRNLFNIYSSGYFPSYIANVYAEAFGSIGSIDGGLPISFNNCLFDFEYISNAGKKTLLTSNSNNTRFNDCTFRYYGNNDTLTFSGKATFANCYFSGTVAGTTNSVFINNNNGTQTVRGNQVIINDTLIKPNSVKITLRKSRLSD